MIHFKGKTSLTFFVCLQTLDCLHFQNKYFKNYNFDFKEIYEELRDKTIVNKLMCVPNDD